MTTPPTALPEHALTTAADLRAVREQWGDLLVAIEQRPADTWPPVDNIRDHLATPATEDDPALARMPLVLRQHPAPANLTALDAALAVEAALFTACDTLAARYQRPVRTHLRGGGTAKHGTARVVADEDDRADPRRWTPAAVGPSGRTLAPGSRAHGLHWAAVWLEGRALGEDQGDGMFYPLGDDVLADLATVARRARRRVEAALGRDSRTTTLPDPCPWCRGELLARTVPGGEPSATCQTGEQCPAPAALDRGRRTWRGADLAALWAALDDRRRDA